MLSLRRPIILKLRNIDYNVFASNLFSTLWNIYIFEHFSSSLSKANICLSKVPMLSTLYMYANHGLEAWGWAILLWPMNLFQDIWTYFQQNVPSVGRSAGIYCPRIKGWSITFGGELLVFEPLSLWDSLSQKGPENIEKRH